MSPEAVLIGMLLMFILLRLNNDALSETPPPVLRVGASNLINPSPGELDYAGDHLETTYCKEAGYSMVGHADYLMERPGFEPCTTVMGSRGRFVRQ